MRPGSRTALRAAITLGGSLPSSRLSGNQRRDDQAGADQDAGARHIAPNAASRKPGAPPLSPRAAASSITSPPQPSSPYVASRRSRPTRRVSGGGTEAPSRACAGDARSTAREPTHDATAAETVMTTAAPTESDGSKA